MSKFSLYQRKEKAMPNNIEIDGVAYDINADFRNILRIFAMLKDKNIPEQKRISKLAKWFYTDDKPNNIVYGFVNFVDTKEKESKDSGDSEEKEKSFDYEFDAEEIYVSFLQEYKLDLFEIPFLHWYKFKIMLSNLSENSPFKRKIQLRFMDLSSYRGQVLVDLTEAKESVQLPVEYTDDELRELREFDDVWGKL